ncbi:helix-turn-helix domain-containing protein [Anderseniella sp. Alg231-50]|uniref:helix-turn-helix domain-containing protein n=1 Tax=Anderseniella sp. Alg231-50 TaxID=1922226 RepID=UPI000D555D0E
MDKRDRSEVFRNRLLDAMARNNVSRSALARKTGVDRSTIGQLLKDDLPRLPNAQLAADAASALGVSTDWLLGLTGRPERPGDIVAAAMSLSPAERLSADAQLMQWYREAAGYKVRHVPATLPDILKTERMLDWEYSSFRDQRLVLAINAMRSQLEWLQSGVSDYEIALPVHELEACAAGTAYYAGVEQNVRLEQLSFIAKLCRDMFPRLRLFLFDAHKVFSAPVTVFGPNLAVIYVGQCYLAFRESQRVRSLTDHFDWLVREATVDAREVPDYIGSLVDD